MTARQALSQRLAGTPASLGAFRLLPGFLVVGAKRSGSTSLYEYVVRHPDVIPSLVPKGTHYFDVNFGRGWAWYRSRFPLALPGRRRLTGEGSPYYMFHPQSPKRIADALPDVKILVALREPVSRAWSHWNYERQRGFEDLDFEDAVRQEPARLEGEAERLAADGTATSFEHRHHSYLARSRYADQLAALRRHISDDRMLVIQSEALYEATDQVMQQVYDFLGLRPFHPPDWPAHQARQYPNPAPSLRDRLEAEFAEANERLYADPLVSFRW